MEFDKTMCWAGFAAYALLATSGCGGIYTAEMEIEAFSMPAVSTENLVCYHPVHSDGWSGQVQHVRLELEGVYEPGPGDPARLEGSIYVREDDPANDPSASSHGESVICVERSAEDREVGGPYRFDAGQSGYIETDSDDLVSAVESPEFWLGGRITGDPVSGEGRIDFSGGRLLVTVGL